MKTKEDKQAIVESLTEDFQNNHHFYLADTLGLNAESTSALRRKCYEQDIKLVVVKNTLLKRVLDQVEGDYDELYDLLEGPTAVMFTETANLPGKLIREFRKKHEKPLLKGAYVEESIYKGDEQLETLAQLKSREELIGDIVSLLQSPVKNVVSALQSGGNTISGVLQTLSEREE